MTEPDELASLFAPSGPPSPALQAAARAVLEGRRRMEELVRQTDDAKKRLAAAETTLINLLGSESRRNIEMAGVLLSPAISQHYRIAPADLDKPGFVAWLLRSGGHDLLKRTVEERAFSHFCRALAASGKTLHPLVTVFVKRTLQTREKG